MARPVQPAFQPYAQNPSSKPPPQLFRVWHVVLATAVGGPLGGGATLALNERRLGHSLPRAFGVFVVGAIGAFVLVALRWMTRPLWWLPLYLSGLLVMGLLAGVLQGSAVKTRVATPGGALASGMVAFALGFGGAVATAIGSVAFIFLGVAIRGPVFWSQLVDLAPHTFYGSCDMRRGHPTAADLFGGPVTGDEQVCFELSGMRSEASAAQEAHRVCHYEWSETRCSRSGVLAGCRDSGFTEWWYPSSAIRSADDVKEACELRGLEFIEQ
jgi:hypothetical protein